MHVDARSASLPRRRAGVDADHRSPRACSASAAASPERASPTTRYGPPGSGGRGRHRDRLLVDREADRRADRGDDPEAQDDLRLRPRRAARSGGGSAPSGRRACGRSGRRRPGSATDSASITKIPPSRISSISVFVITASPAIAPPSPSEPVSPMKIVAGNALNHRKPTQAPTRQPASSARSVLAGRDERDRRCRRAARSPRSRAARPSRPSVRLTRARRAGDDEVDQHRVEDAEVDRGRRRSAAAACRRRPRLVRARRTTARSRSRSSRAASCAPRRPSERRLTIFV